MLWQRLWQSTVLFRCASTVAMARAVIGKNITVVFSKAVAKPSRASWTIACSWLAMTRLPQSLIGRFATAGQSRGGKMVSSVFLTVTVTNAALDVGSDHFGNYV